MDTNFNEWQTIWQAQKSQPMQLNELINQLNAVEKRARAQRLMLFLLSGALAVTAILGLAEFVGQKYYQVAYLLILSAIGIKLYFNYSSRYSYIENEAELNNQVFLKGLKKKMTFSSYHVLLFLFLTILGLNFALLGMYEKGTIFNFEFNSENRILIHLFTFVLLFFGCITNLKRLKRNKRKLANLANQLEENR
ncbi:MAG: hypothetical protein AB8H12_06225 [Lewinella sp.]